MRSPFTTLALPLCAIAMLLGGCVTPGANIFHLPERHPAAAIPAPAPEPKRVWTGDGVQGAALISINITEQRASFFKGKKLVGETDISSGRAGYDTPPGHYSVIQKDKNHRSTLYGDFVGPGGNVVRSGVDINKDTPPLGTTFLGAKMPFFLRFQSGYGLHAGWLPGHRASHGCVRLPITMAEHFFYSAQIGTPVIVKR